MSFSITRTSAGTAVAVASVAALALVGAPGAGAADVTATVTEGQRSASFADASIPSVVSQHSQTSVGVPLALTVDDSTGTRDGWSVSASITPFVYSGTNAGTDIPAANFSIVPGTITGPAAGVVGAGGSLDVARPVASAAASANGVFTQPVQGTLVVPADSYAGTYAATLTTTISTGP